MKELKTKQCPKNLADRCWWCGEFLSGPNHERSKAVMDSIVCYNVMIDPRKLR